MSMAFRYYFDYLEKHPALGRFFDQGDRVMLSHAWRRRYRRLYLAPTRRS